MTFLIWLRLEVKDFLKDFSTFLYIECICFVESGILVSLDNADAVAQAVVTLLRDKERGKGNGSYWPAANRTKSQHRRTRRKDTEPLY